jgi:hypothetical protein
VVVALASLKESNKTYSIEDLKTDELLLDNVESSCSNSVTAVQIKGKADYSMS